jgi:thioredoxin-related protein
MNRILLTLLLLSCIAFGLNFSLGSDLFGRESNTPNGKKIFFPITNDFSKAKEMGKAYFKPIALVFTGSDWCLYSQRLLEDTFFTSEFFEEVKKYFIFVHVDFPECNPQPSKKLIEQHYALKETFNIKDFPVVVLLDEELQEITRMGFSAEPASQYGKHLLALFKKYKEIKHFVETKGSLNFTDVKEKYIEARELGSAFLIDKVLQLGLKQDRDCFFHLEKYSMSSGEDKQALRKKILSLDKDHKADVALRLAILDYQELKSLHSQEVLNPLLEYVNKEVTPTQEHWRVHMLIAEQFYEQKQQEEALEHARLSLKQAPENHKADIKKFVKALSEEAIAQAAVTRLP